MVNSTSGLPAPSNSQSPIARVPIAQDVEIRRRAPQEHLKFGQRHSQALVPLQRFADGSVKRKIVPRFEAFPFNA